MRFPIGLLMPVLLAAGAVSSAGQTSSHTIAASDSVSINPLSNLIFRDNLVRVSRDLANPSNSDLNGLLKFDVSSIPDCEVITAITLDIRLDLGTPNPFNSPILEVHHSTDDAWTRQSAQSTSGPLSNLVSARIFTYPGAGAVLSIPLDLSNYDFVPDLADDAITLVLDNANVLTSRVNFVGPYGTPAPNPAPMLTVLTNVPPGCGCTGTATPNGFACNDSFGVPVSLALSGCAKLGDSILMTTSMSPGVSGPVFDIIGVSDTSWLGLPLPLDLSPLGAQGCYLFVSQELLLGPLIHSGGTVTASGNIPNMAILIGGQIFVQSLIVDLGANALNIVTTEYWDVVIGP